MGLATSLPAVPTVTLQNGDCYRGLPTKTAIYFRYMPGVHRHFPSTGASYDEMVAYFLSYENVTFDFNELLGNQDGHFRWGGGHKFPAQRRSKEFLCQRKPSSRRTAQRGCLAANTLLQQIYLHEIHYGNSRLNRGPAKRAWRRATSESMPFGFRYKHGEHIADTSGHPPEELKALILGYSDATFDLDQLLGNQTGTFAGVWTTPRSTGG
ncbi:hypothetical protein BKA70DRAFT_1560099 [Coprinopsis sp. MPI-PUGE-AT-0042]|nr:hypothetical protein BKA70DRAFT_1560099 [Coprinopsis sp. MPI-PUGE-AT-0042]